MNKLLAILVLTILLNVDVYAQTRDERFKQKVISSNQNSLNNNIETLNQKISSSNQITLIYCKVVLEREYISEKAWNYFKKEKGQIDKIESIIFDNNEDLKNCSDYKPERNVNYRLYKQKVISSSLVSVKEYENYWANKLIISGSLISMRNLTDGILEVPFGKKVKIKLPTSKNDRHTIIETVLKKSDLVRYCMGGSSRDYNYTNDEKSVYSVSFKWDERENLIKSYCRRAGSGDMGDYGFLIVPVSNGKFSRDDVGYSFNTLVELKSVLEQQEKEEAAQLKAKKEAALAKQEKLQKQREYEKSPEGILKSSYQAYMLIKEFYEISKNYEDKFVNSQQFKNARKQIKQIESAITKNTEIKSDKVWNEASELYKKQWASTMERYKSTSFTIDAIVVANAALASLNKTYNKLVQGGAQAPKKDF